MSEHPAVGHDLVRKVTNPVLGPITEREMPSFGTILKRLQEVESMHTLVLPFDMEKAGEYALEIVARAMLGGTHKLIPDPTDREGTWVVIPASDLWP